LRQIAFSIFQSVMPSMSYPLSHDPTPETSAFAPQLPTVQTFLVESERRVIGHCLRLLAAPDLSTEHRQRLSRLIAAAESELQRLAA
jgi:hypothetical protein